MADTSPINAVFLRLTKRAETTARAELIQTFVDVGPLFTLLSSLDHQILYGRRGTGKTHALTFLASKREAAGDLVAYVDLRNIGSSGGIYSDSTRSLPERATCLLVDALAAVHEALYERVLMPSAQFDLSLAGPALDAVGEAISQIRVVGPVESEVAQQSDVASSREMELSVHPKVSASTRDSANSTRRLRHSGTEQLYVNFGSAGAAFRKLADHLPGRRIWILLDEWSSVPIELQPYLADLFRRSVCPVQSITVKIAAIEQRSAFQLRRESGDYVGIEVGADAAADVNLDDFMVFDNDPERAKLFFQDLICRHARAVASDTPLAANVPVDPTELVRQAFTQNRAFEEFVRASEGVPRDAINILAFAATRALADTISVENIRVAAKNWYQRDKDKAVSANERAHHLLHWIIDKVIGDRRARAFLLPSGVTHPLIDALYDARVLHVLKRSVSTHDQPGTRYDVYKLDYGCYVDLISTAKAPLGLLPEGDDTQVGRYTDVPPDDYRSIRRAILDVGNFDNAAGS